MKKYAYLPLPLICVSTIALKYYTLNIIDSKYVYILGCGCVGGFNTNHLTAIIWVMLFALLILGSTWISKGLPPKIRIPYFTVSILIGLYLSRTFIYYNYWL